MKKVPNYLIPALNAGAEKQVIPRDEEYEKLFPCAPHCYGHHSVVYFCDLCYCTRQEDFFAEMCLPVLQRLATISPEKRALLPDRFWWRLGDIIQALDNGKSLAWCVKYPFELCAPDGDYACKEWKEAPMNCNNENCEGACDMCHYNYSRNPRYARDYKEKYGWPFEWVKWVTYGGEMPSSWE